MSVKPILFNTNMVRAILDGRKTVTRRIIKPRYRDDEYGIQIVTNLGTGEQYIEKTDEEEGGFDSPRYVMPPYQPGDILYVREAWQQIYETEINDKGQEINIRGIIANFDDISKICVGLSKEYATAHTKARNKYYVYRADNIRYTDAGMTLRWRPSIHMPKEAARIWLKVTDVRVERLQHIIVADPNQTIHNICSEGIEFKAVMENYEVLIKDFKTLWDSTIKKSDYDRYGCEANPWVWVIEFERCEKPDAEQ
jgi:hypothetical protein